MVVLHLKNGDHVAGLLLANTNATLVLSNSWATELKVPLAAVAWQETAAALPAVAGGPTNAPGLGLGTNAPADLTAAAFPGTAGKPGAKHPKLWKADLNLGANVIYGTKEQQTFFGSATLTYELPYRGNPKKFFRNVVNYTGSYGEANGTVNANQMWGSVKTDFDLTERVFCYNLGMAGFDEIRKIDLQWEVGPGMGAHLIKQSKLALNAELGSQYLVQDLTTGPTERNVFLRFAQNASWQIAQRVSLKESLAYLPQSLDFSVYRVRLESTLAFALLDNLSLNLSVLNFYNSRPAANVEANQLQLRSSLGLHF